MTKKHLQFCIYYMQTGDPQVAYKMTYPRAAVKSLKASVSRLMARPDVAEWVNGTEERVHNRMMRQFHNEHYDQFKDQLLTINQKRTVLTKIIKGETKRVRYIKGKYGPQKVEEDLPVYAVLRAVDLDTRLENFYNYLTRSDTWRKTQNIYVNTPTLQQQVNILINQTTEQEETKDVQEHILSPAGGGVTPVTGVEHSRRTLAQEIPPYKEVPHEQGAEDVLAQDLSPAACPDSFGSGGVTPVTGVEHSRRTDNTTKKTPHFITTEPVCSLRQKKNINRLTKVNRMNTGKTAGKTSNASIPTPHQHETNAHPSQEGKEETHDSRLMTHDCLTTAAPTVYNPSAG